MHLNCEPKKQEYRSCINVLFRSAALAYDGRVAGIEFSGELNDGTAGLWEIERRGGIAVAQHPEEAPFSSMPLNALREVEVDHTVRVGEMADLLVSLAGVTRASRGLANYATAPGPNSGEPERQLTDLACPDCRVSIWELRRAQFRDDACRVGDTFSSKTKLAQHLATEERRRTSSGRRKATGLGRGNTADSEMRVRV